MNLTKTLDALERERQLLEDFICLSEEQLLLLADEDLDGFDALLKHRAELMSELRTIESSLSAWIRNIQADPLMTPATLEEMSRLNSEIVRMANHVIEIDEQAHTRLEQIKQRTENQVLHSASRMCGAGGKNEQ
jgi:hypothetical protein